MVDPSAQAFTRQGIYKRGVSVTFQRISGFAPNTSTFSATVIAQVSSALPDSTAVARTGVSASEPGAISQTDRKVIVMACDLAEAGFPLPIKKNDPMTVVESGDAFTVSETDSYNRAMAGAIELVVTGVP